MDAFDLTASKSSISDSFLFLFPTEVDLQARQSAESVSRFAGRRAFLVHLVHVKFVGGTTNKVIKGMNTNTRVWSRLLPAEQWTLVGGKLNQMDNTSQKVLHQRSSEQQQMGDWEDSALGMAAAWSGEE